MKIGDAKTRRRYRRLRMVRLQYGRLTRYIRNHAVFFVALVAAVVTLPFGIFGGGAVANPLEAIDLRTLACLFCILASVGVLGRAGFFDLVASLFARAFPTVRVTLLALVCATMVLSMFVTNDMALVVMLPLAAAVFRHEGQMRALPFCFIMQNLAANLGGMILPFGNPQNLFIYGKYGVTFDEFASAMWLPFVVSVVLIVACCVVAPAFMKGGAPEAAQMPSPNASLSTKANPSTTASPSAKSGTPSKTSPSAKANKGIAIKSDAGNLAFGFVLLAATILTVFRIIPYYVTFFSILIILLLLNRRVLRHLDWFLLGTFAFFFVFSGNICNIGALSDLLSAGMRQAPLLLSAGASQVISNVPAAILLSNVTDAWQPLLVGVNIGGAGTIVASLATLITIDKYRTLRLIGGAKQADAIPSSGPFMLYTMLAGFVFLAVLIVACSI